MNFQLMSDLVPRLEEQLGLKNGIFDSLNSENENDWSFVIKIHALAEAAISHLLTERLRHPELTEIFSRLEMSNKSTGKAAFIKALGAMEERERRFISALSELRNKLVHDVRNVDFDLFIYVKSMTEKERETFLKNFNLISDVVDDNIKNIFYLDPRQALWYSAMAFLGLVYLKLQ